MNALLGTILPLSLALLVYGYVGYPWLVRFGPRWLWRAPVPDSRSVESCLVLCAAHNEANVIGAMIDAALVGLGPEDSVVVASDASTDGTDEVVLSRARHDSRVRLVRLEGRGGKNRGLNAALAKVRPPAGTAVILTDANATLDPAAPGHLVAALNAGAGCVVGRVEFTQATSGTAMAEGVYWRYENAIKLAESRIGRLPIGNGALFALRAADCVELPDGTGNDLYWPLRLLGAGRRVIFEPLAMAREPAALAGVEEFARKRRMATRQMRGLRLLWSRLDWSTRIQFVSHKGIRWMGLPLVLLALGAATGLAPSIPAVWVVAAGLLIPFVAAILHVIRVRGRINALAFHFLSVQTAALLGIWDDIRGRQRAIWGSAASARGVR